MPLLLISAVLNPVSNVLRTVFSPFQNGFSYIVNKVTDTTDFIREMNGYKEENARLVGEINELKNKIEMLQITEKKTNV